MKLLSSRPDKKLVRHNRTGQYLTPNGGWTDNEEQGKNFLSIFQALEFCCQCEVTDAELVLKSRDGHYQASIPLNEYPSREELKTSDFNHEWARIHATM